MNQLTPIGGDLALTDRQPDFEAVTARFVMTRASQNTRTNYQRTFREYAALADDLALDPLRADAIIAYNEHLRERRRNEGGDLAADTIRTKLKALQSLFAWLHGYELVRLTPTMVSDLLTMPAARKLSPRDILTASEAGRLLAAAENDRDHTITRIMLDGGLRVSEALALAAGDVYAADSKYWLFVAHGKGDKSRDVDIPQKVYQVITAYAAGVGIDLTDQRQSRAPLFDIHRSTAWRIVARAAEAAGIPKRVTPHSLRHTHAHQLRLAGWPIEAIAERLGHASIETTKIYTRPAELSQQIPLPGMPWNDEN